MLTDINVFFPLPIFTAGQQDLEDQKDFGQEDEAKPPHSQLDPSPHRQQDPVSLLESSKRSDQLY